MATKQALEDRLAALTAELFALGQRLNAARDNVNSPEFDQLLAERTRLRNARNEISSQLDRILLGEARSFRVEDDPGTGLVQIRTSDGVFAGRGNTLEEAKDRAIRNGANSAALNDLVDPRAKAQADQGPGTESAGDTVTEEQAAKANGANTQAPGPESEIIDEDGIITDQPATSLPSNAVPAVTPVPEGVDAPGVLPPGQSFGRASDGSFRVDIEGVGSVPTPPIQSVVVPSNITAPDENDNLVSYIYRATRVISNFRQGKFTQELEGAQIFFTVPPQPSADTNRVPAKTSTTEVTTNTPGTVRVGSVTDSAEIPGVTVSDREQNDTGEIPAVTTFGSSLATDTGAQAPLTSQPPTSGTTIVAVPTQADVRRVDNAITAPQQGAREY